MFQLLELRDKDLIGYLCNPSQVSVLLKLPNDTKVTTEQISAELCGLSNEALATVLDKMVKELDIGDILLEVRVVSSGNKRKEIIFNVYWCLVHGVHELLLFFVFCQKRKGAVMASSLLYDPRVQDLFCRH